MDYLEFIARVTSHIPDKGQVMIHYYGIYSNVHRGKMLKAQQAANPFLIIEQEEPFVPSKGWAMRLAMRIALLAVSYQSIKAATANPADSLRYE